MSSWDEPEPEDSVEIRLAGRRQDSGGVADDTCSLLLRDALERWVDSVMVWVGGCRMRSHSKENFISGFWPLKMFQFCECWDVEQ